jgi:hypothetical protein
MEFNNKNVNFRKAIAPEKPKKMNLKCEFLSEYIKLNMIAFQNIRNKNYKLAKYNFEKCIEISREIDEFKYIESLINYSITLYYDEEFKESYDCLNKAKEISTKLYEKSDEINQIYFIHLRILSNMSLISMNLNNISKSKKLFYECISLIKEPKIRDIQIQYSMLRELLYIFFRFDSLNKFHEIYEIKENYDNSLRNESIPTINNNIKINEKGLYYLHKSLLENKITYWLNYLNNEINVNNNTQDIARYIFLLINRIAALSCDEEHYDKKNIENALIILIKYYKDNFTNNIIVKDINQILNSLKNKFNTAVEYYQQLINLEKEIKIKLFELKIKNDNNNENKILINLLFRNALKHLEKINDANNIQNKNEMKNQIEYAMELLKKSKINWNLLSIVKINSDLIKTINIIFNNLKLIRLKNILRNSFHKFKLITLGYINMIDKMKKNYIKSERYLNNQLLDLEKGSTLLKINYTSDGFTEHFYSIKIVDDECFFCIYDKKGEKKPDKKLNLKELYDITVGLKSNNLISKIKSNYLVKYEPYYFLSLWFPERTIDLYFDNDREINRWFEGIYFFNKYVLEKRKIRTLNYFFFTKLKLKLLHTIKKMKFNLKILKQLKYFESQNQLEYQALPFPKTLVLYKKICDKIKE